MDSSKRLNVPVSGCGQGHHSHDIPRFPDAGVELRSMASSRKSVRISSIPEYYQDSIEIDHQDQDHLENNELIYNVDEEDDRSALRKSNTKITSIFDSIEEWNTDALPKSFEGLSHSSRSVLEASWKGELNNLEEALKDTSPGQIKTRVNCKDSEGRTPLMLASAFGNSQVVQFLIQKGAEVNVWDKRRKATPLACAAACGSSFTVAILISHGAFVDAADEENKTPIFWAVQSGSVSCVRKILEAGAYPNKNVKGIGSPLHVATTLSDGEALPIMEILIEFQGDVALCELDTHKTPLHFAVGEGNMECIELLLKTGSPRDAADNRGSTPLHIAAQNGDYEAVEILLAHKADPNVRDNDGRTPLHRAVSKDARATECMIVLLENGSEVDGQDSFGHTPLHLAVLSDSAQIAGILLKYGADITKRTKAGKDCLSLIVRRMPHVIRYIKESLDNAVTIQNQDPNDPQCVLKLDFRPIISNVNAVRDQSIRERGGERQEEYMRRETEFISCLIQTGHKSLLSHPLIEAFIVLKWARVRRFFVASIIFHTIMVLLYTMFVYLVYVNHCPYNARLDSRMTAIRNRVHLDKLEPEIQEQIRCNSALDNSTNTEQFVVYCDLTDQLHVQVIWFCLILIAIFIWMKEIFQMVQEFRKYVKQGEHWIQWILLITVFMAIWPVPMANECLEYWHYPSAAIGVFIAWCLMLVRVGKFPLLGVYIQMLGKVIKNFGVFIMAYACLLIAFTITFCVLFPNEATFANPGRSFISVIVMLAGELSYEELFYNERDNADMNSRIEVQYPVTSQVMFTCFVLVVSIILMNLLVGLAVSDIQSLREMAKLDRLSRQTNSIAQLESFLFSRGLHAFLPNTLGALLRRSALLVPSSYEWTFYFRPHDPRDNRLPDDLQQDALRLATSKQFRRKPSHYLRKRNARGSKLFSTGQSSKEFNETLQRNDEKLLNVLRKEMANGFSRISQKVDEILKESTPKQ